MQGNGSVPLGKNENFPWVRGVTPPPPDEPPLGQ